MKTLNRPYFENPYLGLPAELYSPAQPRQLFGAHLIGFNEAVASLLDWPEDEVRRTELLAAMMALKPLEGSTPVAMCYSGHQFGHYVERLGDGRALLLGQVRNTQGELWDLHLKGGGPTLYSRGSDGRAVLRSSIREYLCSEAMHGLGLPTTRALCLVGSKEGIRRESVEPGAMIVRVAPSHIRFGSFEYCFYNGLHEQLRLLADYVVREHYPELEASENKYLALLLAVAERTALMIAKWQGVGFCHGVMNTDNMSILGLTLDYGPFGFLDTFENNHICNHSDHTGRYAYDQQPDIGLFNVSCLAQALLPLLAENHAEAVTLAKESFSYYRQCFARHYDDVIRAKLGLREQHAHDRQLWLDLLAIMEKQVDFTNFFRQLSQFDTQPLADNQPLRDMFIDRAAFDDWAKRYAQRLLVETRDTHERQNAMNATNPKYILRNHLAETAIRLAQDEGDYAEVHRLFELLQSPYAEQPERAHYANTPPDWAQSLTISCSS